MGVRVKLASGLILAGLAVVAGCSTAARERWVAFFFETEPVAAEADAAPESANVAPAPELPPPARPVRFASVHPPVRERNCVACHDPAERMQVDADAYLEACADCHPQYFSDEVAHGPAMEGMCTSCHSPHRSVQPALLTAPVAELCAECHDEVDDLSEEAHGQPGAEQCARCHDAHFGEAPFLKSGVK